ncbi:helical backbone metal receptor [Longimicrobium sp.]|uniref:ABC transporter substrate-binding protein n=1 Tax=Longimicrobium sp. TaxID=2029185 RepID=UPI002E344348|nr:helical backbone metal receptor [Longimicrobium sp.]HEX6041821.1 helical backbone metal receptor [Longimicrobium sp.]
MMVRLIDGVKILLLAASLAACGGDAARAATADGVRATDANGRVVTLDRPAARVISLVPSATDLLVAAGGRERLVARTDNDHAPELAPLPSVGGMEPSVEKIVALRPDLVVILDMTSSRGLIDGLEAQGIRTFSLGTRDTTQTFAGLHALGRLTGVERGADSLAGRMRGELAAVAARAPADTPTVFLVVNVDPPMTAGPETFMAQMVSVAGGRTAFPDLREDWAMISLEEVLRRQPDWLLTSTGQGGTRERRLAQLRAAPGWRELRAVREGRVIALPSDLLARPGPRLAEAARLIQAELHPQAP